MSEQQSEFVYLDTIEEEPGTLKEDEEIGGIIDNIEPSKLPRRESGVTNTSSMSGTRSRTEAPFMGQVLRAFHQRQMSATNGKRSRRRRRSPRGGLGTPRTSECDQGMTLISNSSSLRSQKSESSTKSETQNQIQDIEKTDDEVKFSSKMDTKDTSSKL